MILIGAKTDRFVPLKLRVLPETDAGGRRQVRLELQHSAGRVQIGSDGFDDDERARALANAFGETLGIPVE